MADTTPGAGMGATGMTDEHMEQRARAANLAEAPDVPVGQRNDAILSVMYMRAEDGWGNHDILAEASELGCRWGKYTGVNLFADWTALLSMLRRVRAKYPNPSWLKGSGGRADQGAGRDAEDLSGMAVHHKDGDPGNNDLGNLELRPVLEGEQQ